METKRAVRYALGGMVAGAVMMMPGIAGADTKSTQGDDFSVDQNTRTKMVTCDQESDMEQVHSDIHVDNSSSTIGVFSRDGDGANGVCGSRSRQSGQARISGHRTVEERPLGDIFGNWVSTT